MYGNAVPIEGSDAVVPGAVEGQEIGVKVREGFSMPVPEQPGQGTEETPDTGPREKGKTQRKGKFKGYMKG